MAGPENWTATELLPRIQAPIDLLNHIKMTIGEEMFNSYRLYYGDDPERYNLSFEAILGTYCNKINWVNFLSTGLAAAAHAIAFHDLNKMTTGKMLFYIQVPRVATGIGVPASRQTTVMVSKYTDKSPITIPFEISAATLTHLRETFEGTLLDRLLNTDAVNTVLRAVKNTADAMERGLVNTFLQILMRHAPPDFVLRTLMENSTISRRLATRVQRANIAQSFKSKMLSTIFLLDRGRDSKQLSRYLSILLEAVTESILDNPDTYTIGNGERLSGVLVSTYTVIQTILGIMGSSVSTTGVKAPASYGKFVLSKENAVTAIAHHAIMADFGATAERIAQKSQADLPQSQFLDQEQTMATIPMNVLKVGERYIVLEHLKKVYKNTDVKDPLEREIELTFFFPLGLHVPSGRSYTTVENKIRLTEAAETALPVCVYFYNKDKIPLRISFSDTLRTLCHPATFDATPCLEALAEAGPPPEDDRVAAICRREFHRDSMANATRRLKHFYQLRRDQPRTANEVKHEFPSKEFGKVENYVLYTELHPFYDFCHVTVDAHIEALCTPRIMIGNVPAPLAPADFHLLRAKQASELIRTFPPENHDATLKVLRSTLTDPQYSEIFYVIDLLIHGNTEAFVLARDLVSGCIDNYFRQRGHLAFAHSYSMVYLIATHLGDGSVLPSVHIHYRTLLAIVRYVARTSQLVGLNGRVADESLLSYVSALFDERLWPPIVHTLPRAMNRVRVVANTYPLDSANIEKREHGLSDVPRLIAMDQPEPLFADEQRLSDEDFVLHKIYYLCVIPAITNNRVCGMGIDLKRLLVDLFWHETFVPADENTYKKHVSDGSVKTPEMNPLLKELLFDAAVTEVRHLMNCVDELFALVRFVPENAQVLEIRAELDPSQRHGAPAAAFESIQHVLYNGFVGVNQLQLLADYVTVIPFHRFYSDPTLAASMNTDIRLYLNEFPHHQRTDGGFPLSPIFAHEYQHWHRTPFSWFSSACSHTLDSILSLAIMHHKISPVSFACLSRLGLHPGFALTIVRTDTYETDTLLYSSKASTALIINSPIVTKEEQDLNTIFHVSQNINSVDMSLGYGSVSVSAHLRRARSDMGARMQDLFQIFPMHVFRNAEIDTWVRQTTGARKTDVPDMEALSILTFGRHTEKGGPSLLHGQRATCEVIVTPVSAELECFRYPNNPRGRSSSMIGVDPYDNEAALNALYNHSIPDPQNFMATNNPWASQKGSLGDILYNLRNKEKLGHNPSFYSPCAQFFTADDIIASNKTLYKTIDDYMLRAQDCVHGDTDIQYLRVEGTDQIVEQPCTFLQEALTLQTATTQAMLESQMKGAVSANLNETHFGNYSIAETIPLQRSILFNNS